MAFANTSTGEARQGREGGGGETSVHVGRGLSFDCVCFTDFVFVLTYRRAFFCVVVEIAPKLLPKLL